MNKFSADLAQVCGCHWAAVGDSEQEVTSKVAAHAKESHGMNEVSSDLGQKLHSALRPTM